MRQLIGWMTALSLPVLLLVGSAAAQKEKDPDKEKVKDPDKEKLSDKWVKAGSIQGKVAAVYEDKRKLRVQVTFTYQKLNAGAVQNMQNAQRDYANARAQGNAQGMINAQNAMRQ